MEHLGTGDLSLVINKCKCIEDDNKDDTFHLALYVQLYIVIIDY